MKNRFLVIAGLALAVGTLAPATAKADCSTGTGLVQTGFGGYFSDCWAGFEISRVYENAGNVNLISYFNGMPARTGTSNSPTPGGFSLFDNNCGSTGQTATTGMLCTPDLHTISWLTPTELVFGLQNPSGTWIYTGTDASRNSPPLPAGVQNFLWEVTNGGQGTGSYLLGWEDLNSGCMASGTSQQVDQSVLTDEDALGNLFATCNDPNAFGFDNDYNDFYMLITPLTLGTPTEVVPEPVTMTLLATGLVGLGGASIRRRRKQE